MSILEPLTKTVSRRGLLTAGATAGIGLAVSIDQVNAATGNGHKSNDIKILNNGLYYEHQAIWTYQFAAGKLSNSDVGKAVLAIASSNLTDHQAHRNVLTQAIRSLGGKPVAAEKSYDLSSYLKKGEGALDSDVNIAKLALALEVDAAIAYTFEAAKLKTPALITAGASIGTAEAAHATAIRAAFKSLGINLEVVPAAFFNLASRSSWVLTV